MSDPRGQKRPHFGFKLPNCGGVLCEAEWANPETIRELSLLARELAYDSIWLHDHLLTPRELRNLPSPAFYEPVIVMTALAAAVPDIKIGVATLILPLREPVVLAKQIATLEHLFPGRAIVGLGVGQYESEFQAFGSDHYHQRGRVADEYLAVMEALWDQDAATVSGTYRSIVDAQLYPKVRSRHEPPIWIGGNSQASLRRACRFGSGWICSGAASPAEIRDQLASEGTAAAPLDIALTATVSRRGSGEMTAPQGGHRIHQHASVIAGDAGEVASQLNAYVASGVTHFLLSFRSEDIEQVRSQMRWFAGEVRPLVSHGPDGVAPGHEEVTPA